MVEGIHRSIGEVLQLVKPEFPDVTISKIRFLESQGLLRPDRTPSGYRKFYEDDVERLRWILRQQREQFLPLKVIKEKLDAGAWRGGGASSDGDAAADGDPAPPAPSSPPSHPLDIGPSSVAMTKSELAGASNLPSDAIDELERFGLLAADEAGDGTIYGDDALLVAKAAAGLIQRGLEVRHLRSYKLAAEREAGMLEQIVLPLVRQRDGEGRRESVKVLGELILLGDDLRRATLRRALASHLD